jgi:GNAT superfamily N-acetyltransferase
MVRVRREARGLGIGSALLDAGRAEARALGLARQWGRIEANDAASLDFAAGRGFREVGREASLVLDVGSASGEIGPGIVELAPEHLPSAYEVAAESLPEIAVPQSAAVPPYEEWVERETKGSPVAFAALDGDRVIGFARLYELGDQLENGLTAVRRSHRRRGVALALKRAEITWAREHGYREITTSSVEANVAMRFVNERLGYRPLREEVVVEGVSG